MNKKLFFSSEMVIYREEESYCESHKWNKGGWWWRCGEGGGEREKEKSVGYRVMISKWEMRDK